MQQEMIGMHRVIGCVLVSRLLIGTTCLPQGSDRPMQRAADVDASGARVVMIHTNAGRVDVTGSTVDRRVAAAISTTMASAAPDLADSRFLIERHADTVYVRATFPEARPGTSYGVTIQTPAETSVRLNSAMGNARVSHVAAASVRHKIGDVTVDTIAGDVEITSQMGALRVRQAGGSVLIPEASGSLEVHGAGKNVTIDRFEAGSIAVTDVIGDVRLKSLRMGSVDVANVRGDVTIDTVSNVQLYALKYIQIGGRVSAPARRSP
jgi:hypothetical protein